MRIKTAGHIVKGTVFFMLFFIIYSCKDKMTSEELRHKSFREFEMVENIHNLEQKINTLDKSSAEYLKGLMQLLLNKQFQLNADSSQVAPLLREIKDVFHKREYPAYKGMYNYLMANELLKQKSVKSIDYALVALPIFEKNKDTTGLIHLKLILSDFNKSNGKGEIVGNGKNFLELESDIDNLSKNASFAWDQLEFCNRKILNYNYQIQTNNKKTLDSSLFYFNRGIQLINKNPQYEFFRGLFYVNIAQSYKLNKIEPPINYDLIVFDLPIIPIEKPVLHYNLGLDYLRKDQLKKALEQFDSAIKSIENRPSYNLLLRDCYLNKSLTILKSGKYNEAYFLRDKVDSISEILKNDIKHEKLLASQVKDDLEFQKKETKKIIFEKKWYQTGFFLSAGLLLTVFITLLLLMVFRKKERKWFAFKKNIFKVISHDLKAPLYAMDKSVALVQQKINSGDLESVKNSFDKYSEYVFSLNLLVTNILDWAWQKKETEGDIPVNQFPDKINESLSSFAQVKKVALEFTSNFKASDEILSHKNALVIVVRNIITNCITHTDVSAIVLDFSKTETTTAIIIKDNASPMAEDFYDRFMRVINSKKSISPEFNSGLGLILIRRYLNESQARLKISRLPEGNSYTISFRN